ncbi:MAG: putative two-component system response regulator [Colwellia sp.]|jgi:putative two-component system response regulator
MFNLFPLNNFKSTLDNGCHYCLFLPLLPMLQRTSLIFCRYSIVTEYIMNIKQVILIVDDQPINLSMLSQILSNKYQVRVANSGKRALAMVTTTPLPDLILLDIMMPDMDGYSVLSELKSHPVIQRIPVIFVTTMDTLVDEEYGLSLGAVDYVTKPIRPAILMARVATHLKLKQVNNFLYDQNDFLEQEISRRMDENLIIQNVSIRALAHLAETRDPETGQHILRTQSYVKTLAQHLYKKQLYTDTIDNHYIDLITRSAPLHDIGKVGIPDSILLKNGKLDDQEWEIMKCHAEFGAKAIELAEQDVKQPVEFLTLAKEIARSHHEKWDGSGYPDGLSGNDIPLSARLMAIADVFDALASERVYKKAFPLDEVKQIIMEGKAKHFDPIMVEAFIDCFEEFSAILKEHA